MMVVFSQNNFWQQPVLFDRSLWTFLTCFRGYTCATSIILLVHFSPLSFLRHFLCSPQWDIVSIGNGPQNGTITVFCVKLSQFDALLQTSWCCLWQSSRITYSYMPFQGCYFHLLSIKLATLNIHKKQPHSSTSSSHYLTETYKRKECLAVVLPAPSCWWLHFYLCSSDL